MRHHLKRFMLVVCFVSSLGTLEVCQPIAVVASDKQQVAPSEDVNRLYQQGLQQLYQGFVDDAKQTLEQVLAKQQQASDRRGEAQTLTQLAEVYYWLGYPQRSRDTAQTALALWRNLGDRAGEADALERMGEAYSSLNDFPKALEILQQTLSLRRELSQSPEAQLTQQMGFISTLLRIGAISYKNQQPKEALAALEQGQTLLENPAIAQTFPQQSKAEANLTLGWIGWITFNQGDREKGIALMQTALEQSKGLGVRSGEANATYFLGEAYFIKQDYAQALTYYQQYLAITQRAKHEGAVPFALKAIANIQRRLNQPDAALQAYQEALTTYRAALPTLETPNPEWEADTLWAIANTYRDQQQHEQAAQFYQQALTVYQSIIATSQDAAKVMQSRDYIASLFTAMGIASYKQQKFEQAVKFYQQAVQERRELDAAFTNPAQRDENRRSLGLVMSLMGQSYRSDKQFERALETFLQALEIYQDLQTTSKNESVLQEIADSLPYLLTEIGHTYGNLYDYPKAIEFHQRSLAASEKLKNPRRTYWGLRSLADAYDNNGEPRKGIEILKQALEPARQMGDRLQQAGTYYRLSQFYNKMSQYPAAIEAGNNALAIYQELQKSTDPDERKEGLKNSVSVLNTLATLYQAQGQLPKAYEYFQQSRKMLESIDSTDDQSSQYTLLNNLALYYLEIGQYNQARALLEQVYAYREAANQRYLMALALSNLALTYDNQGQTAKALEINQKALELAKAEKSIALQATLLNNIATIYKEQGAYAEALKYHDAALAMNRQLDDLEGEGTTLNNIGSVYSDLAQYDKSLEFHERSLKLARQIGNVYGQATALGNIGLIYQVKGDLNKAFATIQQSLALWESTGNPTAKRIPLNNIGYIYGQRGDYAKALEMYQQSLAISQEVGDRAKQGITLNNVAGIYRERGQYARALELHKQALVISQEVEAPNAEARILNNIGIIYQSQGNFAAALEQFQQSLAIYQRIGNRLEIATVLGNLGILYHYQGQYGKALDYLQQELALVREIGARSNEAGTLQAMSLMYRTLGQYPQALNSAQQALKIQQEIGELIGTAVTLTSIAKTYQRQQQYDKALEVYQQALTIFEQAGNKPNAADTLSDIGWIYLQKKQFTDAIAAQQKALEMKREMGDRLSEGLVLQRLGETYLALGSRDQAQAALQQALAIHQEVGYIAGEAETFDLLGGFYETQQPDLAIAFYKQAVNTRETIRSGIRNLSKEQQETYTQTVSETYRKLANLLITKGRILEAQKVLELLKAQELREFTRDTKSVTSAQGIAVTAAEEKILKEHGSLIALGKKVEQCKQTRCAELSQLNDQLQVITEQYRQTVEGFETAIRDRRKNDDILDPSIPRNIRKIVDAQPGTVLIYPFVLEDKTWLLWAGPGGIIQTVEVAVSQQELGEAVLEFRQQIQDAKQPEERVQANGQKLYNWLIRPIEKELKANNITNLVFSLDRVTRYIPMAALFDGQKYLIENYTISTVLSAELTDMRDRLPRGTNATSVLAVGASEFQGYRALPNVVDEVSEIVRQPPNEASGIYPGKKFLNQAFDFRALRTQHSPHRDAWCLCARSSRRLVSRFGHQ